MRVKSILAAVAAIAALSAAPAFAETVNSGHVGVSAANFSDDNNDAQEYALNGALAFPLSGAWGAQVDAQLATIDSDADNESSFGGAGHVFHRTSSRLIGAFVGATDTDDVTAYGGGVEADFYLANWTLGGRVAYSTDDSDVDSDTWSAEVRGAYFVSDNFTIGGGVGYADTSVDVAGVNDFSATYVGLDTEYQLATSPFSFFGGASYVSPDEGDEVTAVQFGVRWNWNSDSLRDRDRSGASLAGFGQALSGVL
jgi:hypothetical protein